MMRVGEMTTVWICAPCARDSSKKQLVMPKTWAGMLDHIWAAHLDVLLQQYRGTYEQGDGRP